MRNLMRNFQQEYVLMKKSIKKILALLISAVLVLSLTGCTALDNFYKGIYDSLFDLLFEESEESSSETEAADNTYDEEETSQTADSSGDDYDYTLPEYTGYDDTQFLALCEELTELASGTDYDAVQECYDTIITEFDALYDQEVLAYILYCEDASDTDAYDEYNDLYLMAVSCSDAAYLAMKAVLDGPCGDEFAEYIGGENAEYLSEYEELTDQELEWAEEENDLIAEYNAAYEEFDASGSSDYSELNATVGPIYLELVALRTEMAQYYGYDNYAEYADAEVYGRDFSTEEAELFHAAVKEISEEYYDLLYNSYAYFGLYYLEISFTEDELLSAAYTYGSEISDYVEYSLSAMLEYSLYNIDDDDARINGSYTTSFSNGASYIFINMDGWSDFQTFTHELGHFTNGILTNQQGNMLLAYSGCYDVLEIHSNGLEALYTNYYSEIFGNYYNYAYSFTLMELMVNVVDGAIYDEFQRTIYENPDMTLDEINELYASLQEEYGNPYAASSMYNWVLVPHNFENPMYYISYGVSGLAAIQIWALSVEDYDSAVEVWEDIVSTDASGIGYLELLEECGLKSFVDDGVAAEVCQEALDTAEDMVTTTIYYGGNSGNSGGRW